MLPVSVGQWYMIRMIAKGSIHHMKHDQQCATQLPFTWVPQTNSFCDKLPFCSSVCPAPRFP